VFLELPARRGELGAGLVPHEQAAPQLLFQRADPRAHGRLRHVQPLGGADEVAGGDDGEKGARELGFHLWRTLYRVI
jgi:hypothetical protein